MLERKQKQIERDVSRKAEFNLLLSLRNYVFLKQSRLLRHSVLANMKLDLTPGGQSEGLRGEVWLGDLKYCTENSQFENFNLETQIVNHQNSSSNISDTTSSSSFI